MEKLRRSSAGDYLAAMEMQSSHNIWVKRMWLAMGPLFFIACTILIPLDPSQNKVLGAVLWMLIWWVSEVVPMAITAVIPILLFPLAGIMKMEETCLSYSNRFVFLFLGGFLIAIAMEKWQLHRRIAMAVVRATGTTANRIVLGFLLATYFISMWISNTATTLMMFPIASSVLMLLVKDKQDKGHRNFSTTMMLSIAYGSSIGGIATLVGSPPNASMAGIMSKSFGIEITFLDWMRWGLPFSAVLLVGVYFVLVQLLFPNKLGKLAIGQQIIEQEWRSLGVMSKAEWRVFFLFLSAAILWMTQAPMAQWLKGFGMEWSDTTVAMLIGSLFFLLPSGKGGPLLVWRDTERLPWGILLMFGGGMSLAQGFEHTGLINLFTSHFESMQGVPVFQIMLWMVAAGLVLTALISNIAMVNAFVPLVAAAALALGIDPVMCVIPVTMAASCDFMFPMSTPPNAIVYSSGLVRSRDMLWGGLLLNVLSFGLLALLLAILG
jgi:solute carrier family 13 (sodium-dependent dicarboxylate transporter), member 2/3/5